MKKRFFIYSLFLSFSCLAGLSLAAQQQKKPSERSFTEEVNRIKQMQILQRSRLPKQQTGSDLGSNTPNTPNNNPQTVMPQQPGLKPSERPIEMPKKPIPPLKTNQR